MSGLEDLGKLDAQFAGTEAASAGVGSFEVIPEDTKVAVIVKKQTGDMVGQNQTPVCKITFEVVAPAVYAKKKIWHDFWLTEANLKYLKRDLTTLGWQSPPNKPTQLMQATDASLLNLGAQVTVGIEQYQAKDKQTGQLLFVPVDGQQVPDMRKKNVIKFFNAPYKAAPPAAPAPSMPPPAAIPPQVQPIPGDDIPF